MLDDPRNGALRAVLTIAALMIIVAGLDAAGNIILPLLFSAFLAILTQPMVAWAQRIGVPVPLAILVVVLLVAAVLALFTAILAQTVSAFTEELPRYEEPFEQLVELALAHYSRVGIEPPEITDLSAYLEPSAILGLVGQTVNAVVGVLSRLLIVTVMLTFILLEATDVTRKIRVAFGGHLEDSIAGRAITESGAKVQRYLVIKTLVSLVTGALAWLLTSMLGVDFALLWGLVAFLLNYVPSIGSIVAGIPPVLLAMVQHGPGISLAVALGYLAINITLGSFLEPRLLGRSLGISPLVVLLSLLFWGWVWGPVGMLFSVPMTVIAKLILESHEETTWIAVMLGNARDIDEYNRRAAPPDPAGA